MVSLGLALVLGTAGGAMDGDNQARYMYRRCWEVPDSVLAFSLSCAALIPAPEFPGVSGMLELQPPASPSAWRSRPEETRGTTS